MIKTIYHFVQGRSFNYPSLDSDDVYKHVFYNLDFGDKKYSRQVFDKLLVKGEVLRY